MVLGVLAGGVQRDKSQLGAVLGLLVYNVKGKVKVFGHMKFKIPICLRVILHTRSRVLH